MAEHRTPEQIVDDFVRTATTQRDRLLAEMLTTYRMRAEHWEKEARLLMEKLLAANGGGGSAESVVVRQVVPEKPPRKLPPLITK